MVPSHQPENSPEEKWLHLWQYCTIVNRRQVAVWLCVGVYTWEGYSKVIRRAVFEIGSSMAGRYYHLYLWEEDFAPTGVSWWGEIRAGAPPTVMKRLRPCVDMEPPESTTEDNTESSEQDESSSLRSSWSLVSQEERRVSELVSAGARRRRGPSHCVILYCLVWELVQLILGVKPRGVIPGCDDRWERRIGVMLLGCFYCIDVYNRHWK